MRLLMTLGLTGLAFAIGCASAPFTPIGQGTVVSIVRHFTEEGFPSENAMSTIARFAEDRSGRAVNINSGIFWYSRDARRAITFDVDGCPQSGDPPITSVIVSCIRTSRVAAAREVWGWLEAAKPPRMPPHEISDDRTGSFFEATWSPSGRTVHVKAWVVKGDGDWVGVLQIYPQEVTIVSVSSQRTGRTGRQPNEGLERGSLRSILW
jgi:hypothetical protein